MGHRGRESLVRCEKCGREVRRDKALFIEKPVFSNPLERKDVYSETYTRVLTREVSYCISCGKHARLFQKKKKMQEQAREREKFGRFGSTNRSGAGPFYSRRKEDGSFHQQSSTPQPNAPSQVQPQPAQPAVEVPAEKTPDKEKQS